MNEPEPVIPRPVLDLAREVGSGVLSPTAERRARQRFEDKLARHERSVVALFTLWFAERWVPAVALCVVGFVFLVTGTVARLGFSVRGASVAEGNFVQTSAMEGATITFSDGTLIEVEPTAAVRITSAGFRGAALVQERGKATYAVVHRRIAAWSVEAGPYHVQVTGTRFSVAWSPESGSFVTELYEGSVVIDGPGTNGGVHLRQGQRLRASVLGSLALEEMNGEAQHAISASPFLGAGPSATPLTSESPKPSAPPSPLATSAAGVGSTVPSNPEFNAESPANSASPSQTSSVRPPTLAERLAKGEAAAIAAELEAEGVAAFAARASAADLAIAADAARYAGKSALSNAALAALRTRHPGSREATLAAFHLGRAAEGANPTAAVGWYDTYLQETGGGGALALEARGRKMALVARTAGKAAARPLAEAYLATSPKGPHAALAESILAPP